MVITNNIDNITFVTTIDYLIDYFYTTTHAYIFFEISLYSLSPPLSPPLYYIYHHTTTIGFVGAVILGPRNGRFGRHGEIYPMHPHNLVLSTIGTLYGVRSTIWR